MELPADAGHLGIQELMLCIGASTGHDGTFELSTKASDPARSTDVGLKSRAGRRLVRIECINTIGDIGAAIRSSDRKQSDAEALAIAVGNGQAYSVHEVWVVRHTRRNRALIARYPHIFASRFPGSSRAWVTALMGGTAPPREAGLIWCDVRATRIFEWRRGSA